MKQVFKMFEGKRYLIYIVLGVLLFTMVFNTQFVILSYGDCTIHMEYTLYGYCIGVSVTEGDAESVVYNEVYIGNSYSKAVSKAVTQLEALSDTKEVVKLKVMGFPRNNEKLENNLKQFLEETGRTVEIYDTSKKT